MTHASISHNTGHSPLHECGTNTIYSMYVYTYSSSTKTTLRNPRERVGLEHHYLSEATSKVFAGSIFVQIFRFWKGSVKALNFLIITP